MKKTINKWTEEYKKKVVTMEDAAKQIRSGDWVGTGLALGSASPKFMNKILDRWKELKNVSLSDNVVARPGCKLYDLEFMKSIYGHINYCPAFSTPVNREIYGSGLTDHYLNQSSDITAKYARWCDVFICQVTPPNAQGYVNFGLTNFHEMETIRDGRKSGKQRLTIGEVNDQQPVIYGDNWMHVSEFDLFVENSEELPKSLRKVPGEIETKIGEYVLELIDDGDTIQMGIGTIPEAVVGKLFGKHDLGIHTEMFPVGLPSLVEKGIVTNGCKPINKGITVATFCIGDQAMYDYVRENPCCEFYPSNYTNNPFIIAQHPNMVAMNMALVVDLSGQIGAEGIGHRMISGPGGQLDFMIGAYFSKGGKGITLLYSSRKLKDGTKVSAIVPEMLAGTPVSVPRHYADYVITEYGIAHIKYGSRRQKAEALINIAHPDFREELRAQFKKNFYMAGFY